MKLALVFGGNSYEHEISIVSAIALKKVIKQELDFIFLDEKGNFWLIEPSNMKSSYFAKHDYQKAKRLFLQNGGFFTQGLFGPKDIGILAVINLVHGGDGEDGTLASMFDFYGIKYVGPRAEASVLSFNKLYTKFLADVCGVKALPYKVVKKMERDDVSGIEYPVIVKPCRLGSSIGVSVVKGEKELDYALDVAFEFDDTVLLEPFVENVREFNVAGAKCKNELVYSNIEEPKKEGYLDFEKKYLDFSRTDEVGAAAIDEALASRLKESFKNIYNFGFAGAIIRCDFFVIDGDVYLNEVNPIPGSMGNYLFHDFNAVLNGVLEALPRAKRIAIDYKYINEIKSAKGKL